MKLRHLISAFAFAVTVVTAAAQSPKYIFYYIGDGMGLGPVMAAETYNRTVLGNSDPLLMFRFPVVGLCATYSASSDVTDSAAAGTALSTGYKTKNGMLGMGPDDVTPGAFYAHVPNRAMSEQIDRQMAQCGYQFVAGAQLRGTADKDGKDNGVLDLFRQNKVQIVRGPEGIKDIDSERVVLLSTEGIGDSGNIGYTIDSIPGALNLPIIARTCLAQLEKTSPDKFFMMIEGGNIDHALHGNDGGSAIKEILNFNEALAVAFDFYEKRRHRRPRYRRHVDDQAVEARRRPV